MKQRESKAVTVALFLADFLDSNLKEISLCSLSSLLINY